MLKQMNIQLMSVKIHWNCWLERWVIRDMLGQNCYEMPDCAWFRRVFPDLDKTMVNVRPLPCSPVNLSQYPLKNETELRDGNGKL